MIEITKTLTLPTNAIEERFVRAAGAGGQNVNKVSTAVELRFDARHCRVLSTAVFLRLKKLAGRRMTSDGVVVIQARSFRTQDRNRKDAQNRLADLVREALVVPKFRRVTKPKYASKLKRLDTKKRKSNVKKMRGKVQNYD